MCFIVLLACLWPAHLWWRWRMTCPLSSPLEHNPLIDLLILQNIFNISITDFRILGFAHQNTGVCIIDCLGWSLWRSVAITTRFWVCCSAATPLPQQEIPASRYSVKWPFISYTSLSLTLVFLLSFCGSSMLLTKLGHCRCKHCSFP